MKAGFTPTGDWRRMARALDPTQFGPALQRHIAIATQKAAHLMQARVRKVIREGIPPPNAALTIMIKGSTGTLRDRGDLFGAVSGGAVGSVDLAWNKVFVGVLRTSEVYDIAKALHDGAAIKVTERMRRTFWALWLVGQGRMPPDKLKGRAAELWARAPSSEWRPLKAGTAVITIPGRPFLRKAFENHGARSQVGKLFAGAVRAAMREVATSGPAGP